MHVSKERDRQDWIKKRKERKKTLCTYINATGNKAHAAFHLQSPTAQGRHHSHRHSILRLGHANCDLESPISLHLLDGPEFMCQ